MLQYPSDNQTLYPRNEQQEFYVYVSPQEVARHGGLNRCLWEKAKLKFGREILNLSSRAIPETAANSDLIKQGLSGYWVRVTLRRLGYETKAG